MSVLYDDEETLVIWLSNERRVDADSKMLPEPLSVSLAFDAHMMAYRAKSTKLFLNNFFYIYELAYDRGWEN